MHKQNFEILEWEGGEYLREFGRVLMLCVCVVWLSADHKKREREREVAWEHEMP